ncbi:MAG: UDP-N-acetylmuramate--L-alanine ligase [Planctomycetota bacterium]
MTIAVPERGRGVQPGDHVHLVGIGGCGMSGLAHLLSMRGCAVTGSDLSASPRLDRLSQGGIRVDIGQSAHHVQPGTRTVVVSAAVNDENPEVREARRLRIPVLRYSRVVGELMSEVTGIAVAGTHGKTTTSSLIAQLLQEAGFDPSYLIGGEVPCLGGGSHWGRGRLFIVEACEYARSFLDLHPAIVAVTNLEADHLDYYESLAEIVEAFRQFVDRLPDGGMLVAPRELLPLLGPRAAIRTLSVGIGSGALAATGLRRRGTRFIYRAMLHGQDLGPFSLSVPGRHNVLNALVATGAALAAGADPDQIRSALPRFTGAGRRLEKIGTFAGVTVFDDYAHHPTEVRATLDALVGGFPGRRVHAVFQPHQASRTRLFLEDFASAFDGRVEVIVPDIYLARDSESDAASVSSLDLVERIREGGGRAEYVPELGQVIEALEQKVQPGDLVVTMGAGNVNRVAHELVRRLARAAEKC